MLLLLLKAGEIWYPLFSSAMLMIWAPSQGCLVGMKTETPPDSLDNYFAKEKNKEAQHPGAVRFGLKVSASLSPRRSNFLYYVTGTKTEAKISDNCRLAIDWDAKQPDETVERVQAHRAVREI
jgi:hypothetical protein